MWLTPLGTSTADSTVADSNAAPLSSEDPIVTPVSTIAALARNPIRPLSYIPPTPTLSGEGGALNTGVAGFRIHSYTGTGSSTFTIAVTTPPDPYA